MANENSKPQAQTIPLAKIHDLPGVFISKQPDKAYGGLVTSIQANGVREPVILRIREDGEYQLVTGYRRYRASELAKRQDIPALVYEMTPQEAVNYRRQAQSKPDLPVPGKLVEPPVLDDKSQKSDTKGAEKPTTDPQKMDKPADPAKDGKAQDTGTKTAEPPAAPLLGRNLRRPPPSLFPPRTANPRIPAPRPPGHLPPPPLRTSPRRPPPPLFPPRTANPKIPAPRLPGHLPLPLRGTSPRRPRPPLTSSRTAKPRIPAPRPPRHPLPLLLETSPRRPPPPYPVMLREAPPGLLFPRFSTSV